jgi:hypothetical protein
MRFTLAACLALTAYLAVICFLLTTQPSVVAYCLLIVITIFAPACAVAGIVYGRDNLRAFCIGAALPLALLVWTSVPHLQDIRFDPESYGWYGQPRQTMVRVVPMSGSSGMMPPGGSGSMPPGPGGSSGPMSLPMAGSLMVATKNLSDAHELTLYRVKQMTSPTCSLTIAAILSGMLVMAIRGGMKPKESNSTQPPSAASS